MHIFLNLLGLVLVLVLSRGTAQHENPHVKLESRLASTIVKPGGTGEIILSLTPAEGIHINTDPTLEVELEKSRYVHPVGITSLTKDIKTGYLDANRPVRFAFRLSKDAAKGKHVLKGTVRYFYCSDVEGWCNRFEQPLELSIVVR